MHVHVARAACGGGRRLDRLEPRPLQFSQKYSELWAFTALEVYDISTCLNFPEGEVTFSNLNITAEGTYYPTWDCQTPSLQCNLAVTSGGPTAVTIAF